MMKGAGLAGRVRDRLSFGVGFESLLSGANSNASALVI